MATFPHNLCGIRQDGHAEQHTPVVLRSEVERGMPRQRRTSADALVSVPCTLVFRSAAAAAEFEAWYYADGYGWFDFTLPRTGTVVQARVVGGDIGGLTPITPAWNASERTLTLEYIRPAFVQLPPGLHTVNPVRVLSVQRNSVATYIDDAGLLQTAAANVARWQGGQLLVEAAATNIVTSSDLASPVLTGAGATKATVNRITPRGVLGDCTAVTTGTVAVGCRFGFTTGGDVSRAYAGGVWACADVGTESVAVDVNNRTAANFTLTTAWQRVGAVGAPNGVDAFRFLDVLLAAGAAGRVVYFWGAQVELDALSSYISSGASAATRVADIITVAA